MNRDYYSDIKQVERFIFQNSVYLLTMFDKKVDSYTCSKSRNYDNILLFNDNRTLQPDKLTEDPIIALSKDPTKPIWNCITKTQPTVILAQSSKHDQAHIDHINRTISRFIQRYKGQHEDESNLRLHLVYHNKNSEVDNLISLIQSRQIQNSGDEQRRATWLLLHELFSFLIKIKNRQALWLQGKQQDINFQEIYGMRAINNQASHQILERLEEKDQHDNYIHVELLAEALNFTMLVKEQLRRSVEVTYSPAFISYCPELQLLPELIHPLMLGIYCFIKNQNPLQGKDDKLKVLKMDNSLFSNTNMQANKLPETVFDELKTYTCSKVTFINLDGYDTPTNTLIAKYLSKYLQYMSFPVQQDELVVNQTLSQYFSHNSQQLIKCYLYGELSEEEREMEMKVFKLKEKCQKEVLEYYKRMFIFPINSIALKNRYNFGGVGLFSSNFVLFVFRELLLNQIKQFNPSVVVVSYSGKLGVSKHHFEQIMKQLTILSNMKIIFYCNLTKIYTFQQPLAQDMLQTQPFYDNNKLYNLTYNSQISLFQQDHLNYDLFDKLSIFLKISSGTHSLNKGLFQDNPIQKYCNYKILKYAGQLFKLFGKNHPVLQRMRNRSYEYLKIDKIMGGYYMHEAESKEFENGLGKIDRMMLDEIEGEFVGGNSAYREIVEMCFGKFGRIAVDGQIWRSFVMRYKLSKIQQKEQQTTKYFARLRKIDESEENSPKHFISMQFEIQYNGYPTPVSIAKHSQICYDLKRKYNNCFIFLLNHLPHPKHPSLMSYCGVITPQIQSKYQTKIQLRPIQFMQNTYTLSNYQYFAQFSYFQAEQSILLFWPVIYDMKLALLHQLAGTTYIPTATNLIFIANKSNPLLLSSIQPCNASYSLVLPRIGCTAYQPRNSQHIYIFGGFYTDSNNYLSFQSDISQLSFNTSTSQITLQNVPKQFSFSYKSFQDTKIVTKIHNDAIRPRVQYQIYELEGSEDMESSQIFLLGGVGQKFMRPYSMIGYTYHHVKFDKTGKLSKIKRLKFNTVYPINLNGGVRLRSPMQLPTIQSSQNRQIYTHITTLPINSLTYSWYTYTYKRTQSRYIYDKYDKCYQYGLNIQQRAQIQQPMIQLRQNDQIVNVRVWLRYCYNGMENQTTVIIVTQRNSNYLLNLGLELNCQVLEEFVNLEGRQIPLTGVHIKGLDIWGLEIYAIVMHPVYTRGRYILAYCDLSNTLQTMIDNNSKNVYFKEIYRFDQNLNHHVLKCANNKKFAILHGCPLQSGRYTEMLFKRQPRGQLQYQNIIPSNASTYFPQIPNPNSLSFFIQQKQSILCFTFRTINRRPGVQQLYLLIEQLQINGAMPQWLLRKTIAITLQFFNMRQEQLREGVMKLLDVCWLQEQKRYELFIGFEQGVYSTNIDIMGNIQSYILKDKETTVIDYYSEKYKKSGQDKYAIPLLKTESIYQENRMEEESLGQ